MRKMRSSRWFVRHAWLGMLSALLLVACSSDPNRNRTEYAEPDHDLVAAIHAAGERMGNALAVKPLADPGADALQKAARADASAGRYDAARYKLARALELNPGAPDLLQAQAELAIRTQQYDRAQQLAYRSWQLGPKLGSLCARNWQTIAEVRALANNPSAAETARRWVKQCNVAPPPRY